jgi:two-component system, NarL family, nitrate/nitrite response regulator NarL
LLLDLDLPGISGLEVLRRLPSPSPVRAVVLSSTVEKRQLLEALQKGARGILLKSLPSQVLFKALREIKLGGCWIDRTAVADFVHTLREGDVRPRAGENNGYFGLTERERKIVSAVVDGLTNKDIAQRFSISEQTVKHHLTSIFGKVRVTNRLELALFAMDNGLIA